MKAMHCRKAEILLVRSQDDALRADASAFLTEHLIHCADCRQLSSRLTRQAERLTMAFSPEAMQASSGVIAARALSQWDAERRGISNLSRRRNAPLAWAASTVALAGATAGVVAVARQSRHAAVPEVGVHQVVFSALYSHGFSGRSLAALRAKRPESFEKHFSPTLPALHGPPGRRLLSLGLKNRDGIRYQNFTLVKGVERKPTPEMAKIATPVPFALRKIDDLSAINTDPAVSLGRWAQATPDDWAMLEARVRASIQQGDDFVEVPFPRVAVRGDRTVVAEAIDRYRREAQIVDPRLQREVTLSGKGTPFADLCSQIHDQTGVALDADQSVADEKVTIFCTKRPLRDMMRQVSRLFGFTWQRDRVAGGYRYTLTQTLQAEFFEEDMRNRDRNAALEALDADMQGYRPYLNLTPDEALREGSKELHRQGAEHDPSKALPSAEWLDRLDKLCFCGWGAIQLYFRLTPEQRAALERQERLTFQPEDYPAAFKWANAYTLPADFYDPMLQSLTPTTVVMGADGSVAGFQMSSRHIRDAGRGEDALVANKDANRTLIRKWAETHREFFSVSMKIEQPELGKFQLKASSSFTDANDSGAGDMISVAEGISPSVRAPDNAARNRTQLSADAKKAVHDAPAFPLSPLKQPLPGPLTLEGFQFPAGITSADALEALHRATGIDIIADYFTRLYDPKRIQEPKAASLLDGLNNIADTLGLYWDADAAHGKIRWLSFRDAGFFNDRRKEVPAGLLERWSADHQASGYLPLADLREIGCLSDAQLDSANMEAGAMYLYNLPEWRLIADELPRPLLRFVQSLSPEHQDALWSAAGLAVNDLTPEEKQRMLDITSDYGAKATRLYGLYTHMPDTQKMLDAQKIPTQPGSHFTISPRATLYIDFREGDKPFRVGMGSYGG